jgi:lambda repressor-like predicted transcriptional regulator
MLWCLQSRDGIQFHALSEENRVKAEITPANRMTRHYSTVVGAIAYIYGPKSQEIAPFRHQSNDRDQALFVAAMSTLG